MNSANLAENVRWSDYSDTYRNLPSLKNRTLSRQYSSGGKTVSTAKQPVLQEGGTNTRRQKFLMPSFLISTN